MPLSTLPVLLRENVVNDILTRVPWATICSPDKNSFYISANTMQLLPITKTCLYNFDPLKPHFYIVKLGFTGVYIIFLFLLKNIDCGYSLEPPRRGGSNEYPQSMFWAEIWKIAEFLSENFQFFFGGEIFLYLNRRVFVMSIATATRTQIDHTKKKVNGHPSIIIWTNTILNTKLQP